MGNETGTITPGRFVWHELNTQDPERSEKFYRELFGWTFDSSHGSYVHIIASGEPVGGVVKAHSPCESTISRRRARAPRSSAARSWSSVSRCPAWARSACCRTISAQRSPRSSRCRAEDARSARTELARRSPHPRR